MKERPAVSLHFLTVEMKHCKHGSLTGWQFNERVSGCDWIRRYCAKRGVVVKDRYRGQSRSFNCCSPLHRKQHHLSTSVQVELSEGINGRGKSSALNRSQGEKIPPGNWCYTTSPSQTLHKQGLRRLLFSQSA